MTTMKKETLYLDTSVPSAYFDERTRERRQATEKFWMETLPRYQACVSEITLEELDNTKDDRLRRELKSLVKEFKVLKANNKINELAGKYIDHEVIPDKYFGDALHVAIATFYEISYLVSWNFEHLVKVKTRRLVKLINNLEGYKEIEIVSPQEL